MIIIDLLDVLSGSALGCVSTKETMDWGLQFEATGTGYDFGGIFIPFPITEYTGKITWEEYKCDPGSIGEPCDPSTT